MGLRNLEQKLFLFLQRWPDARKNEPVPGMKMTYWELGKKMIENRKKRSKVRKLVDGAIEAGLIRTKTRR